MTGRELAQELDKLFQQERGACKEIYRQQIESNRKQGLGKRKVAVVLLVTFIFGFFVSPFLYPKFFGYKSAEECLLDHTNNYGMSACYDLYPSIKP